MLIRDESFIHIQGWMVTRLGLKGLELMVYACIHGFCNDGESDYHGSRQYLADFCGTSVRNISRCLRSLLDRGLIVQTYHSIDNSEVRYITIVNPSDKLSLGVVTNCHEGSDKMTQGSCQIVTRVVTNCHEGSDKLSPAIKDDNKEDTKGETKDDNKVCCDTKRTRFQKPTLEEVREYVNRNGDPLVDPERFIDWHESNGWKVGRNSPMKDWKAAVRNWERMEKARRNHSGSGKAESVSYMQNEYSKEHLEQKEVDSMRLLDQLLEDE